MIANIVSESAITSQGHKLTYDTYADLFTLNHLGDLSTFTRRDNGLHVCNSGHPHVYCQGLPTQISHITWHTKLLCALNPETIQNANVTTEHVQRATSIYGSTLDFIKGRLTRKKGIPIPTNIHQRVKDMQTMYTDTFVACTLHYLITKLQPLDHIMISLLPERSANAIRTREEVVSLPYCLTMSKELILSIYTLGSQARSAKHEPQVERAVRTVKEGTRLPTHAPI